MQTITATHPALVNELPEGAQDVLGTAPISRTFLLAGHAVFTLVGRSSRFTFKVTRKDPEPGSRYQFPTYFVALLTGSDNTADYTYVGILDDQRGQLKLAKGSRMGDTAPAVVAFRWALGYLWTNRPLPAPAQAVHCGRCGRCGRLLTVPESVATGIGPDCAAKMGVAMVGHRLEGTNVWTSNSPAETRSANLAEAALGGL